MATNTTATLSTALQTYYDRRLLEIAKTTFVYANFGQRRPIPRNSGKTINWRRYNLFTPSTTTQKLTEGTTPTGQTLSQTTVTGTLEQYGAYVEISDLLDLTAIDPVIRDSVELLGEQLGTVVEWLTRDAMLETTSIQRVGNGAADTNITASNVLTIAEIQKAVRTLKTNKARRFTNGRSPHFVCIVDPAVAMDIQKDADWKAVRNYQDAEAIYSGELGRMYGVVFVESTEGYVNSNGASAAVDLHHSLIFGADAYGVADIDGSAAIRSIIKPVGSAGTADPLDQRSTVGAKVMAYAAKVLNPNWIIDIRSAASA